MKTTISLAILLSASIATAAPYRFTTTSAPYRLAGGVYTTDMRTTISFDTYDLPPTVTDEGTVLQSPSVSIYDGVRTYSSIGFVVLHRTTNGQYFVRDWMVAPSFTESGSHIGYPNTDADYYGIYPLWGAGWTITDLSPPTQRKMIRRAVMIPEPSAAAAILIAVPILLLRRKKQ